MKCYSCDKQDADLMDNDGHPRCRACYYEYHEHLRQENLLKETFGEDKGQDKEMKSFRKCRKCGSMVALPEMTQHVGGFLDLVANKRSYEYTCPACGFVFSVYNGTMILSRSIRGVFILLANLFLVFIVFQNAEPQVVLVFVFASSLASLYVLFSNLWPVVEMLMNPRITANEDSQKLS